MAAHVGLPDIFLQLPKLLSLWLMVKDYKTMNAIKDFTLRKTDSTPTVWNLRGMISIVRRMLYSINQIKPIISPAARMVGRLDLMALEKNEIED